MPQSEIEGFVSHKRPFKEDHLSLCNIYKGFAVIY